MNVLNTEYNNILAQQLIEENAKLVAAVEEAKKRLIHLEVKNGIKQIPLPNQNIDKSSESNLETNKDVKQQQQQTTPTITEEKQKPVAKPKKEKPTKQPQNTTELPVDVGRLDLRIAKVEDVQRHPDADSLYVLKINCGEEKPRTVCSGLVKYVPIEELRDRYVVLLCNLKPVKMRGITSEAMVMCASSPEAVEVLVPPAGCQPGESVHCEGYKRRPDPVMNPKKKIFESVAPDLHTNDSLVACYKGAFLNVPGKGNIVAKSLKNVPVK